jgi:hypothetical protein
MTRTDRTDVEFTCHKLDACDVIHRARLPASISPLIPATHLISSGQFRKDYR